MTLSASSGWMCSRTSALKTRSNALSSNGRLVRMPGSTYPLASRSGHSFSSTALLSSIPQALLPWDRMRRMREPFPVPASSTEWNLMRETMSGANRHPQQLWDG